MLSTKHNNHNLPLSQQQIFNSAHKKGVNFTFIPHARMGDEDLDDGLCRAITIQWRDVR